MAENYYSFVSFLRQGIANSLTGVADLSQNNVQPSAAKGRASIDVAVSLDMDGTATALPQKKLELYGPGDIVGIDSRAIIRTEPQNYCTNFEPNYLPCVEFYEEDFPWRFSPSTINTSSGTSANNKRLTPWLALVVIEESELASTSFSVKSKSGQVVVDTVSPLPSFKLKDVSKDKAKIFPSISELWAWAHVHVNGDVPKTDTAGGTVDSTTVKTTLDGMMDEDGDFCYSRILCPRRLGSNKTYYGFLIPVYEVGRLAGLGKLEEVKNVSVNKSAWEADNDEFPFYYHWYFKTGSMGDFEMLAKQLKPKPANSKVGFRDINVDVVNNNKIEDMTLQMPGALRVPLDTQDSATKQTIENYENWEGNNLPHKWQKDIAVKLNIQLDADKEPVISSPIYGRWHALTDSILYEKGDVTKPLNTALASNWIHELNLDPRYRAAAAMGTKVVQNNQEELMAAAWNQIDTINEANKKAKQMQLVLEFNKVINKAIVSRFNGEQTLSFTNSIHKIVKAGGIDNRTIYKNLNGSAVPNSVTTNSFKKATRNTWRIAKVSGNTTQVFTTNVITKLNNGTLSLGPVQAVPARIATSAFFDTKITAYVNALPAFKALSSAEKTNNLKSITDALSLNTSFVNKLSSASASRSFAFRSITAPVNTRNTPPATRATKAIDKTVFKDTISNKAIIDDLQTAAKAKISPVIPVDIQQAVSAINQNIKAFPQIKSQLTTFYPGIDSGMFDNVNEQVYPVMAYPVFDLPMYMPLKEISNENFLPNINLIEPNSVSLLETNQRFIESYMVGLNHEMSRELLWRGFPTDQRGSYFRMFWDNITGRKDIKELHTWNKKLGLNSDTSNSGMLVLVLRGDILKKYPNTVIYAQKAAWDGNVTKDRILDASSAPVYPVFEAKVDPDIYFLGFQLDEKELIGDDNPQNTSAKPGWYFVLHERPGEPRFGLDINRSVGKLTNWSDMTWRDTGVAEGDIVKFRALTSSMASAADKQASWPPKDAAQNAYIFYQQPVLVAIHASKLL